MSRSQRGRLAGLADLLLIRDLYGDEGAQASAPLLGFAPSITQSTKAAKPEETLDLTITAENLPQLPVTATAKSAPAAPRWRPEYWVLDHREMLHAAFQKVPVPACQADTVHQTATRAAQTPSPPPKQNWRNQVRAPFGGWQSGRRLDMERAVRQIAQGRLLRDLPHRLETRWPHEAVVIIDRSAHLAPYQADYWAGAEAVQAFLGRARVRIWWVDLRGEGVWCEQKTDGAHRLRRMTLHPDTLLLALTDLGTLTTNDDLVKAWADKGWTFAAMGVTPTALLPGLPLSHPVPAPWRCMRQNSAGDLEPWSGCGTHRRKTLLAARDKAVTQLAALAALALQVEQPLLRRLVALFSAEDQCFGLEALLWDHPRLEGNRPEFRRVQSRGRDLYRLYLRQCRNDPAVQRLIDEAWRVIQETHRVCDAWIQREEAMFFPFQSGRSDHFDPAFVAMLVMEMERDGDRDTAYYARSLQMRQFGHPGVWTQHRIMGKLVAWQRHLLPQWKVEPVPPGSEAEVAALEEGRWDAKKRLAVVYRAGRLFLEPALPVPTSTAYRPRPPLLTLETGLSSLLHGPESAALQVVPVSQENPMPLCDNRRRQWLIRNEESSLSLAKITKPDVADSIGEDQTGVFIDLKPEHGKRRLRWLPPQSQRLPNGTLWHVTQGVWVDARLHHGLSQSEFFVPPWAHVVNQDQYGIFADFEVAGVTQRMRWMRPGSFWMGSSEENAEYDDEKPRHEVWLTQPFWLAETACSQALWQAVMGDNPSANLKADHPVEQVDYESVTRALGVLSGLWPNAGFQLPTEAQWEYACRGGTQTVFSFGDSASSEQANFNGRYPYGGGEEGIARGETLPVKSFSPNPWGLYQMHGNVYEWCSDGMRTYGEDLVIDPRGPGAEGEQGVVRGGGYFDVAGLCRSACRNAYQPGSAGNGLGFRLAAGSPYLEKVAERPPTNARSADGLVAGTDTGLAARRHKEPS